MQDFHVWLINMSWELWEPVSWSSNWNTDRMANCIFNGTANGQLNQDRNFQKLILGQKNPTPGLLGKEG